MTTEYLSHVALLSHARDLLNSEDTTLMGRWPRATALITRGSLEQLLNEYWRRVEPTMIDASMRAQVLCLSDFVSNETAAATAYLYGVLSGACHYHPYELPPTARELSSWINSIEELSKELVASDEPQG